MGVVHERSAEKQAAHPHTGHFAEGSAGGPEGGVGAVAMDQLSASSYVRRELGGSLGGTRCARL